MKRLIFRIAVLAGIAGIIFLATVGCCDLLGFRRRPASGLLAQLQLTPAQGRMAASLEKDFLARKTASCEALCAKRAQMIQTLKQPDPDRATLNQLIEEIGQEQVALEKATMDHLLNLGSRLEPPQRERLIRLTTEQLRDACEATACGATVGCSVTGGRAKK